MLLHVRESAARMVKCESCEVSVDLVHFNRRLDEVEVEEEEGNNNNNAAKRRQRKKT